MKFFATLLTAGLLITCNLNAQYDAVPDSALQNLIKTQYSTFCAKKLEIEAELVTRHLPKDRIFDSLKANMIAEAETSRDRELMCWTYNMLSRAYLSYSYKNENAEQGKLLAERCLELANEAGLDKYKVGSYLRFALYYRHLLQNQKALDYNNQALALATSYGNDSLLAIAYSSMGDTWNAVSNKLARFQALLNARDFAEKSGSHLLMLNSYIALASFYQGLEEYEKAKDLYTTVTNKSREWGNWQNAINGIRGMAGVFISQKSDTLALAYYNKAFALADSLHMQMPKVNIYLDILNFYINSSDASKSLAYLKSTPVLMQFITNYGIEDQLYKLNAYVYLNRRLYDSALYYVQKGATAFYAKEGVVQKYSYNVLWAEIYKGLKRPADEKDKLLQAKSFADSTADISLQKDISESLYKAYDSTGDFKQALVFYKQMNFYKDSIDALGKQKDLITAEIGNENKRVAREKLEEAEQTRVRNNLQYMGITAAIATLFIMLVIFGVFKMSPSVIKALGFFAFIFLFEFVVLLLDNQIHHLTEGEPWKVLGIKIIIIAVLLPLHHTLEERVTHYLTNKAHRLRDGLHFKPAKVKEDLKGREN